MSGNFSKLRISLSEKRGEIKGVIDLPRDDPGFVLQCMAMTVDQFAKSSGVPPREVMLDILRVLEKMNAGEEDQAVDQPPLMVVNGS